MAKTITVKTPTFPDKRHRPPLSGLTSVERAAQEEINRDRAKPRRYWEDEEQEALISWARLTRLPFPPDASAPMLADYLFACPNGGKRGKFEAARLGAQGVKAGVSDLILPVARGGYFGLFVEMKARRPHAATVTDSQVAWLRRMAACGYHAEVCYGWDTARDLISEYISRPPTVVAA